LTKKPSRPAASTKQELLEKREGQTGRLCIHVLAAANVPSVSWLVVVTVGVIMIIAGVVMIVVGVLTFLP